MAQNMDRRGFLKASLLGAAAAAVASTAVVKDAVHPMVAEAADIVAPVTTTTDFPYQVDSRYQRMSSLNVGWMRLFDPNQPPIKFVNDDVSKISGKKDTGKDLPLLNAEQLGIKGRPLTLNETGVRYFTMSNGLASPPREEEVGYRRLESALVEAAFSVERNYNGFTAPACGPGGLISRYPINPETNERSKEPVFVDGMYNWDSSAALSMQKNGKQWKFTSPEEANKAIKKAAIFLGADLAGVAPYDERWVYADWARIKYKSFPQPNGVIINQPFDARAFLTNHEAKVFGHYRFEADWEKYAGFTPKSVIVIAIEEDYAAMRCSPGVLVEATTGKAYSAMGEISYKLAVFLRQLGYSAVPCGNDTGLSVPTAVQAGLGEAGRNGLLVTQKYGPRVRLAKVYTDLEITPDKPRQFGVREFCRLCKKCCDSCPGQAISHEDAPKILQPEDCGTSENPYTEKWEVNFERCISWFAHNAGCSNCIAVCSWNKIKQWNHDIARISTQVPLLKDAARKFDEWFGYNGPVDSAERIESGYIANMTLDFWNTLEPIK
ncbi:MAG: reductive dehalogenase [Dehalobacter sp. 4CP]|uniref:reductive dehalogenase n=1 Tax=Dehalobacter sp. CP TaxID=2594474 RepID=UPI0013C56614|nr:reductive dehalogenase [Dehalobacter sp. 4CP]